MDPTRKFVVSYFLVDDTILINQIPDENAGLVAGRFLIRSRIPKPREEQAEGERGDRVFYRAEDLYVGAIVRFNDHTFLLAEADEYVFDFMEKFEERERFPHSNIRLVMSSLDSLLSAEDVKAMMAVLMERDPEDTGLVSEADFRKVLRDFVGFRLSEHQTITLCRRFRRPRLPEQEKEPSRYSKKTPKCFFLPIIKQDLLNFLFQCK